MIYNLTLTAIKISKIFSQVGIYSRIYHVCSKFHKIRSNLAILSNRNIFLPNSITFSVLRQYSQRQLCWNCGKEKSFTPFCPRCDVLQKVNVNANYFNVIGIEQNYNIDTQELTKKYRKLQAMIHPDKFSTKSDIEKTFSEEWSSLINKAYSVLQNPLKRGLYILSLHGESIDQEKVDSSFLVSILEKHEEVESISDLTEIKKLYKENSEIIEDLIKKISKAFASKHLLSAKKLLTEMKYYQSIQKDLSNKIEQIEEVASRK